MSPLNHKRTTSSLAPPIFYVAKKFCNKKIEGSPMTLFQMVCYGTPYSASTTENDVNLHKSNDYFCLRVAGFLDEEVHHQGLHQGGLHPKIRMLPGLRSVRRDLE